MRARIPKWLCVMALAWPLLSGCNSSGPGRGTVTGQITLDGAPLAQGSILFVPIEGNQGVAAGGPIAGGHYELSGERGPSLGVNRVEIHSLRKSGRMVQKPLAPPGEMVEADEEAVAAQFNLASTLKFEIKAGQNVANFNVQSK